MTRGDEAKRVPITPRAFFIHERLFLVCFDIYDRTQSLLMAFTAETALILLILLILASHRRASHPPAPLRRTPPPSGRGSPPRR